MVNVAIGELLQENIQIDSKTIFENSSGLTKRDTGLDLSNLVNGLSVKPIFAMSDFPPIDVTTGLIPLEQDTSYLISEVGNPFLDATLKLITNTGFLLPAGWNGTFISTHSPRNGIFYTGTGSLFNTLNIDGIIDSIDNSTTNPGVKSTITTSTPHGLVNGQSVNITGTTDEDYSKDRRVISNVSPNTFDVDIIFVADDSGLFDTGALSILHWALPFFSTGTGDLYDITFTPNQFSLFNFNQILAFNFKSLGTIRNASFVVATEGTLTFKENGITFENCDTITMGNTVLTNVEPLNITSKCLTFTGASTRDVLVTNVKLNTANSNQRPIRVDPTINAADVVSITNSPDNNLSPEYFDLTSGGLDQTNPQIISKTNGSRANSMSSAQVGFTNIAVPIVVTLPTQDTPVIVGGTQYTFANMERASATSTGQITNLAKVTRKYPITFSALIKKVAGGTVDIGLLLIKNGSLVLTDTFNLPHSVNTGVIQISATRDFELKTDDTLDLAVVNFNGTSDISVSQGNIVYSVDA